MPTSSLHPVIGQWFMRRFGQPTEPQRLAWPEIAAKRHCLIAAPTGSGKTLSAFMIALDSLFREAAEGKLTDQTRVLYVSPLKALSNDIERNLQRPLAEMREAAIAAGVTLPEIRTALRTGDTPATQRQQMVRRPPHILVTTPESLYLILTSERSREMLRGVQTVIIDEIHALARDKRGSHLSLSLARLDALCEWPPQRVGLSATQRPIDEVARFLIGANNVRPDGTPDCAIVDVGHARKLDLAIDVPECELSAVCSHEQWEEVYERLAALIQAHRSTLIFVNTRRLAERVAHRLIETLGEAAVASHHGSLSKEIRQSAERRLQSGELRAIVATASLELGIDIGYIDLVCQISSPRSIATFLQRVGRSGHSLGLIPKGRLFPLSRDDLMECTSLLWAIRRGELDAVEMPIEPIDILAQQIVAAVAVDDYGEDELFKLCRSAWPYRNLSRALFSEVIELLANGILAGSRRGAYLHHDRINGKVRARRGARLAAITSGGAIPDTADYRVVTETERTFVGTVNEDFAIESMAGDIFLLGNTSWRIRHVRGTEVVVNDAEGLPATVPFWFGEAPGRTYELSQHVSLLRERLNELLVQEEDGIASAEAAKPATSSTSATESSSENQPHRATRTPESDLGLGFPATVSWLQTDCGINEWAARQIVEYAAAQRNALGLVPTGKRIVFERFFDESGGMQLVIHSPWGIRINRAWGLAMRKRFCRSFDFELQAAADDDGIVLSLGTQHSFPVEQLFGMLSEDNGLDLLQQALLAAPMFQLRWRWNASRALALLRHQGGKRVPPHLQRMRAEDLLTAVFPATTQCLEHIVGDIEIPDHPLVRQTVDDCLREAMDVDRWLDLLREIKAGEIELVPRDTREPSPFAYEILNANPYAFLDDAPLEERRARAVATRRMFSSSDFDDLARLDPAAIDQVRAEAWPLVRSADELHDALCNFVALPAEMATDWGEHFAQLVAQSRATELQGVACGPLWVAAERMPEVEAIYAEQLKGDATFSPPLSLPAGLQRDTTSTAARKLMIHGHMEFRGPLKASDLAEELAVPGSAVSTALEALEGEGAVLQGRFIVAADNAETEWCDRRLLARIHRLTLQGARRRVRPVSIEAYWQFLCEFQHATPGTQLKGRSSVREVIGQLQGFESPAVAWEREILPSRIRDYDPAWLDELSMAGEAAWGRLCPPKRTSENGGASAAFTRAASISLFERAQGGWLLPLGRDNPTDLRSAAAVTYETLCEHGALFFEDLLAASGLLQSQLETALSELAAVGAVTCDGYSGVRQLFGTRAGRGRRRGLASRRSSSRPGRWSKFPVVPAKMEEEKRTEHWAMLLLHRYGVLFRELLTRESAAPRWGQLARVLRRKEAQGLVHGGRFVLGVGGEQYALPTAVEKLRDVSEQVNASGDQSSPLSQAVIVSAVDPLNLSGIIDGAERVPAVATNRLAVLDGRVVCTLVGGRVNWREEFPVDEKLVLERAIKLHANARRHTAEAATAELESGSRRTASWRSYRALFD